MLILLFLLCVVFSLLYWQIFYPVILKHIRFNLFEMRDQVRSLAAEHSWANTTSYQEVERFICKTICYVPNINLMSFLYFIALRKKRIGEKNITEQLEREMPPELIAIRDATARNAVVMMLLNSPWEVILSLLPAPIFWALGKLSRVRIYRRAEDFVDNIGGDVQPVGAC